MTLPAFAAYCRDFHGADLTEKTTELRKTYVDAVKQYSLDTENKMCIQWSLDSDQNGSYIVPVASGSTGANIRIFPQEQAICIYYRGSYEGFSEIREKLLKYAKENNMTPNRYFRNIFLEDPPSHGANKAAYITQIALPIKSVTIEETK